eukprot:TRINITY_DN9448_c0_g1_i4.p1 TRINITY_DN9448_c0_g1~~TRINITY_DN9448_c0_g1_i4.p1  ORF type:complete len:159 (-),score=28.16 TRINITY_DN9448_c0_g1_i4:128-604(-)
MVLPQGVPALVVLAVTTVLGYGLGTYLSTKRGAGGGQAIQHAVAVATVAIVFWVWAVHNTASASFDLGVVTFALVLIAAVRNAAAVLREKAVYWAPMAGSCAAVAVNYVLGFIIMVKIAAPWTMTFYMVVGVLWWCIAAYTSPAASTEGEFVALGHSA